MAVLTAKEIRAMSKDERKAKLKEIRDELMHERGISAMGGSPPSPGRIRALRTSISRLLTVINEESGK